MESRADFSHWTIYWSYSFVCEMGPWCLPPRAAVRAGSVRDTAGRSQVQGEERALESLPLCGPQGQGALFVSCSALCPTLYRGTLNSSCHPGPEASSCPQVLVT